MHAIGILRRRWAIPIITALYRQPLHFGELQDALPGLAHKVQIEHLRELLAHGVIERTPDRGATVLYHLTDRGRRLCAAVDALRCWAASERIAVPTTQF